MNSPGTYRASPQACGCPSCAPIELAQTQKPVHISCNWLKEGEKTDNVQDQPAQNIHTGHFILWMAPKLSVFAKLFLVAMIVSVIIVLFPEGSSQLPNMLGTHEHRNHISINDDDMQILDLDFRHTPTDVSNISNVLLEDSNGLWALSMWHCSWNGVVYCR